MSASSCSTQGRPSRHGVQNPQGVAINTKAVAAENCDENTIEGQLGCNVRNTLDLLAVQVVKERSHLPIIVDPSHACGTRGIVLPQPTP